MNQASEPKNGPVLVLLGGTGDLARRMLLPSLFHLEADGLLPEGLRIFGVARDGRSADTYRSDVRAALEAREKTIDDQVAGDDPHLIIWTSRTEVLECESVLI